MSQQDGPIVSFDALVALARCGAVAVTRLSDNATAQQVAKAILELGINPEWLAMKSAAVLHPNAKVQPPPPPPLKPTRRHEWALEANVWRRETGEWRRRSRRF